MIYADFCPCWQGLTKTGVGTLCIPPGSIALRGEVDRFEIVSLYSRINIHSGVDGLELRDDADVQVTVRPWQELEEVPSTLLDGAGDGSPTDEHVAVIGISGAE